jgi:hypothetical protein
MVEFILKNNIAITSDILLFPDPSFHSVQENERFNHACNERKNNRAGKPTMTIHQ